jgi:hypothetical protein
MKKPRLAVVLVVASILVAGGEVFAQIATYHSCDGSSPAADDVYIWFDSGYHGTCAALYAGFYPYSGAVNGGFGLPNDSISSLKVGSSVRARLFKDGTYGGEYKDFTLSTGTMPSDWNDVVSSIRGVSRQQSPFNSPLPARLD